MRLPVVDQSTSGQPRLEKRNAVDKCSGNVAILRAKQFNKFAQCGRDVRATSHRADDIRNHLIVSGAERALVGLLYVDDIGPAGECGERFGSTTYAHQ